MPITTTSASKSQESAVRPVAAAAAVNVNALIPREPATTRSRRVIDPLMYESFINASFGSWT